MIVSFLFPPSFEVYFTFCFYFGVWWFSWWSVLFIICFLSLMRLLPWLSLFLVLLGDMDFVHILGVVGLFLADEHLIPGLSVVSSCTVVVSFVALVGVPSIYRLVAFVVVCAGLVGVLYIYVGYILI